MEDKKTQKIAAAFLLGTVVGGVIALLFAPKSGKELRSDISDEVNNYVDKAADLRNKIIDKAKKFSNDILKQTEKVQSDIRSFKDGKYTGTAEKIESEISRLRNAIKAAVDSYKDTKKVRKFFPDEDKYYFTDFNDYLFQDEDEKMKK
ncbi:MAG: YtxH domain-containing protein [Ignavibacteriaceae bacterium]|nr:YtxH domain-containing protein [Ignavibacteriaceae bacterium]